MSLVGIVPICECRHTLHRGGNGECMTRESEIIDGVLTFRDSFCPCNAFRLHHSSVVTRGWLCYALRWLRGELKYQCAYCGKGTSMQSSRDHDGNLYPACCSRDACLERLGPVQSKGGAA